MIASPVVLGPKVGVISHPQDLTERIGTKSKRTSGGTEPSDAHLTAMTQVLTAAQGGVVC